MFPCMLLSPWIFYIYSEPFENFVTESSIFIFYFFLVPKLESSIFSGNHLLEKGKRWCPYGLKDGLFSGKKKVHLSSTSSPEKSYWNGGPYLFWSCSLAGLQRRSKSDVLYGKTQGKIPSVLFCFGAMPFDVYGLFLVLPSGITSGL